MIKTRFLSLVLSLSMILSLCSISVLAEPTLSLGDFDYSNIKISVSADTEDTNVSEAMVYIYKSDGYPLSDGNLPLYADFVPLSGGAFNNKEIILPLSLAYDSYTVAVYYNGAHSPLKRSFTYYSPSELLNVRKNEILSEAKLASASSDAQVLSNALFDIDSAGGTKLPTNDVIVKSSASFAVYDTVEDKLEVFRRMKDGNITNLQSFDELIDLFESSAEAQKASETREAPVTPSVPTTDTSQSGNTKNPISVSGPVGNSGSASGGSVGGAIGTSPSSPLSSFTDMNGHWSEKYAKILSDKKIINGYEDGSFKPENNVTRAEITKMVVSAFNVTGTNVISFADVVADSWYSQFVARAAAAGIINGYDGKFNPNGNITRQDAALIVFRVLDTMNTLPKGSATFKDSSIIAPYALDAVKALGSIGVLNGDTNGNFNPSSSITRAEIAAVICRALEYAQLN